MATRTTLKLNDREIRQWMKDNTRFDAKADGNGLYIRYRITDTKPVFYFRFKIAQIEHKIMLGKFPEKSLSSARKDCIEHRATIQKGLNPAITRREQKQESVAKAIAEQSANTVNELVDDYFKRNVEGRCKTERTMRQRVDKYLAPHIGNLKIDAVLPMHIVNMLDACVAAGAPTSANQLLSITKRIFDHAIKRNIIIHNPARAFNCSDAGGQETPRKRFLSEDELIKLFKAMRECEGFSRTHYLASKLLLLIGCRKNELFQAKRTDFDRDAAIWIMSEDNKTQSAITIPLSEPAQAIITELLQFDDGSGYLLPSLKSSMSKKGYINSSYLFEPMQKVYALMPDIEPFVLHDFRRSMRTHLGKLGVNEFVAERCLNHKIAGMAGVYDAGDYLPERREALDKWAAFLESCEAGTSSNK